MDYPVSADENGVNLKPEKMEKEKLYHCIFKNKAFLVFKDSQDVMNCYEIEQEDLVEKLENVIMMMNLKNYLKTMSKEKISKIK